MIDPTRLAPPASAPAGLPPMVGGSQVADMTKLLSRPFMVEQLDIDSDGPLFMATPLQFFRFDRDSGCVVNVPVHSEPNAMKGSSNNV